MHPLVELARQSIEAYVRHGRVIKPPLEMTPEMAQQAGAFVSLHDSQGELRGCIGTIEPCRTNLADEIIHNAISAATRDPRFPPLSPEELNGLQVEVDVLREPEPIGGLEELDPKKYGVIVACGGRRGLLLPDLEGVDTAEYQVEIACRKAHIRSGEAKVLYRFEVARYK
jgi:AmmeMemoRadiSam system protein A